MFRKYYPVSTWCQLARRRPIRRKQMTFKKQDVNTSLLRGAYCSNNSSLLTKKNVFDDYTNRPPRWILAGLLTWLGLKRDESERQYDKYDKVSEEDDDDDDDNTKEIIHTIKLGILSMQKGDLDKAETLLHLALRLAQDLDNTDAITYIFSVMANIAYERGDYMKAERLYKDVIQRQLNKGTPQNDNSIIEMSLKLAVVYGTWKQHDKAVTGYTFCIKSQEDKLKAGGELDENTLALWGMSRDWYAQYLLDIGHNKEALSQFKEAFVTSCQVFGDTHPQSLVLLNSLGTVSSVMGEDSKAVDYFNKAVTIGRKTSSEDLPTFLVNLGMARMKLGLKNQAQAACHEALLMARHSNQTDALTEAEECLNVAGKL